jgi:hypothetical protein
MTKFALVAACLLFVGCNATLPQQPAKTTADDPSRKCYTSLGDDPHLKVLHAKVGRPNDPSTTTLAMLASTERATSAEEKKAIQYWASIRSVCLDAGKRFREIHQPPMYAGLVESQNEQFVILLSKLYSGAWSYGEFNTKRKELAQANQDKWRNAHTQETQANRAAQEAKAAQQARADAELSNALLLLQLSQPRPAPVAPPVSCQSRNVGGTVYTDCR